MQKIHKLSLILRVFFQITFIAMPIMLIIFWLFAPFFYQNFHAFSGYYIPSGIEILHPLTWLNCLLGFMIDLLPTAVSMTIVYFLIKLFKLYECGEIFTKQNAKYIGNIAWTMLIGQVVGFIYEGLLSFAMTFNNPSGHRLSFFTFGTYDIYNILTAVMLIVISWVMVEGAKLNDEQKYTV